MSLHLLSTAKGVAVTALVRNHLKQISSKVKQPLTECSSRACTNMCRECTPEPLQMRCQQPLHHLHLKSQVRAELYRGCEEDAYHQESTLVDPHCCPAASPSQPLGSNASGPAQTVRAAFCPHSALPSPPVQATSRQFRSRSSVLRH